MSNLDPATTILARTTPRRRLPAALAVLCLAALATAGYLAVFRGEPPVADAMVLDVAGTELRDQVITRPVEIAADDVSLHGVTIRTGGPAAIRVRAGVTGFFAESTDIRCASAGTDGIVPGHYSALRVRTHGCRDAFVQSPSAPATVLESERDGRPYSTRARAAPARLPDAPAQGPRAPAVPGVVATPPTPITYWPGPTTTGVPAGTTLRNSGSLSLKTAGQVVTGLNITGCVSVYASNVKITKSRITCSTPTYSVRVFTGATKLVLEDVEIDGTGRTATSVCCENYLLRRVNLYNTIDGPRLGTNSTIVDSWVHSLARVPDSHNDTLQTTGGANILIQHNRLEPYNEVLRDPMNACLMVGSTSGPAVTNLLLDNNYCNGGNYSIGVRADLVSSSVVMRGNKFGRNYRYGIAMNIRRTGIAWNATTNVWFDDGRPVPFS